MTFLYARPRSYSMNFVESAGHPDAYCVRPCKHHPVTNKYPDGNAPKHLSNLTELVRLVAEGLSTVRFPRQQRQYSRVHVLLLSWAQDDLQTAVDIDKLKSIFEGTYHYSTECYLIPSNAHAGVYLERQLVETKVNHGMESDCLLIVYYGGHGEIDKRTEHSIWKAWKFRPPGAPASYSPSLDWTELQGRVMDATADVLLILDCCYAGAAVHDSYHGRKELLLAAGKTDKASNQNSFTKALVEELESLEGAPCQVLTLHARLLRQPRHKLDPSPIFDFAGTGKPGIVLTPLSPASDTVLTATNAGRSSPRVRQLPTMTFSRSILGASSKILISVALTNPGVKPFAQTWIDWIRDHVPSEVAGLDIGLAITPEAIFESGSHYMIVSIPITVWNAMPHDPAINFLSIVHSPNLLDESLTKPTALTAGQSLAPGQESRTLLRGIVSNQDTGQRTTGSTAELDLKLPSASLGSYSLTSKTSEPTTPEFPPNIMARSQLPERNALPKLSTRPIFTIRNADRRDTSKPLSVQQRLSRVVEKIRFGTHHHLPIGTNETRLLLLHPAENNSDRIQVTLRRVAFNDLQYQTYKALSYCWGKYAGDQTPIYARNEDTIFPGENLKPSFADVVEAVRHKPIWIRDNLYSALLMLRDARNYVALWIDAICVDQEDNQEKSLQIAKMDSIYRHAERVVVWLGQADKASQQTFELLQRVHDLEIDRLQEFIDDRELILGWIALSETLDRDWFHRRWIIQDIAVARDITFICGRDEAHWQDLDLSVELFRRYFNIISNVARARRDLEQNRVRVLHPDLHPATNLFAIAKSIFRVDQSGLQQPIHSLEYLVSAFSTFTVSEPRDTIFALWNLARETPRPGYYPSADPPPQPDYSKDLVTVYAEFVMWVVRITGKADILCRRWAMPETGWAYHPLPRPSALPSWMLPVQKWQRGRLYEESLVGLPDRAPYNACYNRVAEISMATQRVIVTPGQAGDSLLMESTVPRSLHVSDPADRAVMNQYYEGYDSSLYAKGLHIATVGWATDPVADGVIPVRALRRLKGDSSELVTDKMVRVLVADRGPDKQNVPAFYRRACEYCLEKCAPSGNLNTTVLLSEIDSPSIVREFLERTQKVVWDRCFIEAHSPDGQVLHGLGPDTIERDDYVCILFGCSVPVLLGRRFLQGIGEYFVFKGEAYVHGIMDGSVLADLGEKAVTEQTKTFRIF
ncbi:hypothetical protein LTR17_003739 [Elasticomyces elasticus]|nr:hypothetical protein LTR17_003739 [Elasticomyces elasticus]